MGDPEKVPSTADILARAVIAASPKLAGSASILYEGFRNRRHSRMRDVEVAVRLAVPDERALQVLLDGSEELDALLNRALAEAGQSPLLAKRRLLGSVVANALVDEAQVDTAVLITMVLAQIDAPHVRALVQIRDAEAKAAVAQENAESEAPKAQSDPRVSAAIAAQPDPVVAVLSGLGLLRSVSVYGAADRAGGLTPFAQSLLNDLETATDLA